MNKAAPSLLFSFLILLIAPVGLAAPPVATYEALVHAIREVRAASQARIERAEYDREVLVRLANDLQTSKTELYYMLQFARMYPIFPSTGKLPWGHYRELLSVKDEKQKREVAQEAERKKWTQKELREEIKRRKLATSEEIITELPSITPGPLYTYPIIRLKDRLKIDLGFGISQAQRVRLRRIDAAEILTSEGKEAKALLETILKRDCTARSLQASAVGTRPTEAECKGRIVLQSHDLDQHGRPIADVWVNSKSIDQEMLDQGLAVRISE